MKNKSLASIISISLPLLLIALVVASMLAWVFQNTEAKIAQQQLASIRANLDEIFPPDEHDNDLLEDSFLLNLSDGSLQDISLLGLRENQQAYLARHNGILSGVILPALARDGYNGDIQILVGIKENGEVSGVRVILHRETPGLGDKIDVGISDWIVNFNQHSLSNPTSPYWTVRKEGGEFDEFTGATITPRAVVHKVRDVLAFFEQNRVFLQTL